MKLSRVVGGGLLAIVLLVAWYWHTHDTPQDHFVGFVRFLTLFGMSLASLILMRVLTVPRSAVVIGYFRRRGGAIAHAAAEGRERVERAAARLRQEKEERRREQEREASRLRQEEEDRRREQEREASRLRQEEERRREQEREASRLRQEEELRREREREVARRRQQEEEDRWREQEREAARLQQAEQQRKREILDFMSLHADALAKKRWQLTKRDAYGNVVTQKWDKEKRYFICNVLVPYLIGIGHLPPGPYIPELDPMYGSYGALVEGVASRADTDRASDIAGVTTGLEYEYFCAKRLTECGWQAIVTQASGDQGVDIIACDGDLRAVFQCKFYTTPVGNKAVQEAVAGRLHERADVAAVITNSTYTPSAEELARTTGTILVHHDDIPSLKEIIKTKPS
jgi:hypothetical protein